MFAFAVLYFTGSGHFNMSMRSFAKMKGLSLSDKGLVKVNWANGKKMRTSDSYRCGLGGSCDENMQQQRRRWWYPSVAPAGNTDPCERLEVDAE